MNTERTVDAINAMAERLEAYARTLRQDAKQLQEKGDWEICGEVAHKMANMYGSLRLDLLINRPLREMQREIHQLKEKS